MFLPSTPSSAKSSARLQSFMAMNFKSWSSGLW